MLLRDDVPGRVHELPHALQVALPAEARPRLPFRGQDPVEHDLGRDRRVVDTRQPQRGVPDHARPTHHGVLDGGGQGMPDVQGTRDIRRRLDDHERRQ